MIQPYFQHFRRSLAVAGAMLGLLALASMAPCAAAGVPATKAGLARQLGFDQLLLVKRLTYNANHYYTEYINSDWMPGGNLCVLDLRDGSVRPVVPELKDGVFERFDLSFDAKRVVFAWKKGPQDGYRLYAANLDGSGLRQLTYPQDDEQDLVRQYRVGGHYHHGTDDMQPCYLPDGGIAFISTRCQYGILCCGADDFHHHASLSDRPRRPEPAPVEQQFGERGCTGDAARRPDPLHALGVCGQGRGQRERPMGHAPGRFRLRRGLWQ